MGPHGFFLSNPLCFRVGRDHTVRRLDPSFHQPKYQPQLGNYAVKPLGEICERVLCGPFGSAIKSTAYVEQGVPFIRITNIKLGEFDESDLVYISEADSERLHRTRVSAGDLVISQRGTVGNVCQIPDSIQVCNISANTIGVKPGNNINPKYLLYFLVSNEGQKQFQRAVSGHVQAKITTSDVKSIEVPLPPRPIQDAVADKMDAAYRRKRELGAEAEVLLESIDGYVLGELGTEWGKPLDRGKPVGHEAVWFGAWRRDVKRLDPKRYRYQREGTAPKGLRRLGDLLTRRLERVDRSKYAFEHLQLISLHFGGSMSPRDVKAWRKDIKGTLWFAYPGDLVYSKIDARNGAIGLVTDELGQVAVTSEYPVYRVKEGISAECLKIVLRTRQFTDLLKAMAAGHSGRKRVQPDELEDVLIPVPLLDQQRKIVAGVRARRKQAQALKEKAERVVAEATAEVERMMLGEGGV